MHEIYNKTAFMTLPEESYEPYFRTFARSDRFCTNPSHTSITSISLYLRPESVRKDQITNPHSIEVDWNDPNLDFTRYSPTGVIGDPTYASAELGKRLWEAVVEEAAHLLQEAASLGSDVAHGRKSYD